MEEKGEVRVKDQNRKTRFDKGVVTGGTLRDKTETQDIVDKNGEHCETMFYRCMQ